MDYSIKKQISAKKAKICWTQKGTDTKYFFCARSILCPLWFRLVRVGVYNGEVIAHGDEVWSKWRNADALGLEQPYISMIESEVHVY